MLYDIFLAPENEQVKTKRINRIVTKAGITKSMVMLGH